MRKERFINKGKHMKRSNRLRKRKRESLMIERRKGNK
jgi:hypothetical protein